MQEAKTLEIMNTLTAKGTWKRTSLPAWIELKHKREVGMQCTHKRESLVIGRRLMYVDVTWCMEEVCVETAGHHCDLGRHTIPVLY